MLLMNAIFLMNQYILNTLLVTLIKVATYNSIIFYSLVQNPIVILYNTNTAIYMYIQVALNQLI